MDDSLTNKKQKRKRTEGPKILAETIDKWTDINKDEKVAKTREPQAKGSKKGCMRGKGGPDNTKFSFRGVRQRTSGKWVVEIREPNGGKKLWLGTFGSAVEGALAYDKAARAMYGTSARINFPDYCPNASSFSCKPTSSSDSTINCSQSESSQVRESKTSQNIYEASASEVVNDDGYYPGFPEHDMIDVDWLLGVMDREPINEAGSSGYHTYDAWFENKPEEFNFDFLETEPEDCNISLEDLLNSC